MQKIVKKQPKETFTYECDNIIIKWEISSLIMTMSVPMLWSVHVQGSISKDACKSINVQKRIANEKKIEKKNIQLEIWIEPLTKAKQSYFLCTSPIFVFDGFCNILLQSIDCFLQKMKWCHFLLFFTYFFNKMKENYVDT